MNVNPGGKQKLLRTTVIPVNNPPPKAGCTDTQGLTQTMVYPDNHPDPKLRSQAKGMKAVFQERESVWDKLSMRCGGKVVGKCKSCLKSQLTKDAERCVIQAEAMGMEETLMDADIAQAEEAIAAPKNSWCCMHWVLSLQDNFVNEKPLLQHYIEGWGHVCLFLPKFHCELNLIEMVWGYAKYRKASHYSALNCDLNSCAFSGYHNLADGKFATAKILVLQCFNMCDTLTIQWFFRKTWCYMDTYWYVKPLFQFVISIWVANFGPFNSKGLDAQQTAFAVKKYKSHRRVGLPGEIISLTTAQEALKGTFGALWSLPTASPRP